MPVISIVVPIFNMENLMCKCIDSLLSQTFKDFELLLVDDGSKDGSPSICDEYALKDKRVKVFHKPNGGLSDARNYGLKYAQGEYSIFADPDDWVSPKGLDILYAKAVETNADVVLCDIFYEDNYTRHYTKLEPSALDHNTVLSELFDKLQGFTVNKLIRTSLYKKYGINYPKGIYGCEDEYTMASLLMHDIKIDYAPIAFYHYMYNPNSLTRHYDESTFAIDKQIIEMYVSLLKHSEIVDFVSEIKTLSMVVRAFKYGKNTFTSKRFKREFSRYKYIVYSRQRGLMLFFLWISLNVSYKYSYMLYEFAFKLKQVLKRNTSLTKKE